MKKLKREGAKNALFKNEHIYIYNLEVAKFDKPEITTAINGHCWLKAQQTLH